MRRRIDGGTTHKLLNGLDQSGIATRFRQGIIFQKAKEIHVRIANNVNLPWTTVRWIRWRNLMNIIWWGEGRFHHDWWCRWKILSLESLWIYPLIFFRIEWMRELSGLWQQWMLVLDRGTRYYFWIKHPSPAPWKSKPTIQYNTIQYNTIQYNTTHIDTTSILRPKSKASISEIVLAYYIIPREESNNWMVSFFLCNGGIKFFGFGSGGYFGRRWFASNRGHVIIGVVVVVRIWRIRMITNTPRHHVGIGR